MSEDGTADVPLRRRPLRAADAAAVLALVNRCEQEFFGEPLLDLEDLLADWQDPGLELDRDGLAVLAGDQLVGVGSVSPRGRLEVYLDRRFREPTLTAELYERLEARARHRGLTAVTTYTPDGDSVGETQLRRRGYLPHHTSWVLVLDPQAPVAHRSLPPGYAVRPFRPDDARAAFAVVSEAFGEWESGPVRGFEEWEAATLRRPGVDTAAFRVATHQDRVVGVCIVFDGAGEAWVSNLAVHRDHRHRGLAQQLLAEVYAAARERGLASGGLSTDNRTGALDLYLRLGMRVRHTVHCWSRTLPVTAEG